MDGAQIKREYLSAGPKSPGAQSHHSRSFSFRSDKSGGSQKTKEDLRRDDFWKNGSKSNPNAALSEAQPGGASLPTFHHCLCLALLHHICLSSSLFVSIDIPPPLHQTAALQPTPCPWLRSSRGILSLTPPLQSMPSTKRAPSTH